MTDKEKVEIIKSFLQEIYDDAKTYAEEDDGMDCYTLRRRIKRFCKECNIELDNKEDECEEDEYVYKNGHRYKKTTLCEHINRLIVIYHTKEDKDKHKALYEYISDLMRIYHQDEDDSIQYFF